MIHNSINGFTDPISQKSMLLTLVHVIHPPQYSAEHPQKTKLQPATDGILIANRIQTKSGLKMQFHLC